MTRRFREIHVVSNTHWDREFRFPFQKTRLMLVNMMDYLLDLLEKNPDYTSYTLDAHSIMVEDYLELRPERRDLIVKLVTDRRLFMGPWYTLPDIPNIGQEALVRNLLFGHRISSSFGHTMKVGYTPCSWGQTGQLPQIYAGFDIDTILFYRGISPHECPSEFIWEAPDGTRALAHRFALFARYNYYYLVFRKITYGLDINDRQWWWGKWGETPFKSANKDDDYTTVELLEPDVLYKKEKLKQATAGMLEIEGDQYQGEYFLAMHGHDISWPHPLEPEVVKDSDDAFPEMKIIHSDLEKYFDVLKKNLDMDSLMVLKGERRTNLREGYWTYLLPGTISARTRLKKENFLTETELVYRAEPSATLAAMLGKAYPGSFLELAWKHLLCTHTHDANAGCAPDEVTEDVRFHLRQSRRISEAVTGESLKHLVKNIDTGSGDRDTRYLIVLNTLPFERSEILELLLDLPEETGAKSLLIRDPEGKPCDWQPVSRSDEGLFVDNPWNVPQAFLTRRFRIKMDVGNLPSLGYRVFTIEAAPEPARIPGSLFSAPNIMENRYLRVEVLSNGAIDLFDKQTGVSYCGLLTLEENGETGNAWKHEPPENDRIICSTEEKAKIEIVEQGPLSCSLRIDLTMNVPLDCQDGSTRSEELVPVPFSHIVTLERDSRMVGVVTKFDNRARDHRIRVLFPTNLEKANTSFADSHFDVVERDIALPNRDDWKEPVVGTYPYRHFVDVSDGDRGLCILSEGLQEFEVTRDERRAIALTLVRGVRIKLEVSDERKQELPDPGPQSPGPHEFRMSIYPHTGLWSDAGCMKEALGMAARPVAAQFGKNMHGGLPLERGFLSLDNPRLEVSAIKAAESGEGIMVRIYNPTDNEEKGNVRFSTPQRECLELKLNEDKIREIEISGNNLPVTLESRKIKTFVSYF